MVESLRPAPVVVQNDVPCDGCVLVEVLGRLCVGALAAAEAEHHLAPTLRMEAMTWSVGPKL